MFPELVSLNNNEGRKDIFKVVTYHYETGAHMWSELDTIYTRDFKTYLFCPFLGLVQLWGGDSKTLWVLDIDKAIYH